ncbi:unnamed protein product [Rotaria sordida]|uniref:BTB domain-containing protein n=1 Tax=Rotaria sordida TaxID=392033 RepID=A0A819E4N7_9BILA|nr:unnamed protein product [Rotaria sordida]
MTASQYLSISSNKNILNDNDDIITFNIGGYIYSTKRSTINENVDSQSYLSLIIKNQTNNNGQYFIDRDGKYFSYILNYFREKKLILPENFHELKQLLYEAKFYQLDRLINEIENYLNKTNEKNQNYHYGCQFTLISNLNQNKTILKLIGPLKLITFFHIQTIGEKFLNIISSFNDPKNILCQLSFNFNDKLISCQPFNQLQRFVLTKQAKKMNLIVSYCDDYFYIPTECNIMSRDEFTLLLLNKYNGKLLNTNIIYDDSNILVENWFLPTQLEETYSNGSKSSVH